jgi:predicted nuclease of predicted toxin-antitoxin system
MQFLADMGVSPRTVEFLRDAGHDAIHLMDRGLHELGDPDILALAREEERILLVHDLDFSDLVAASGGEVPSVVVFRLRDMRPASVNEHLKRVLERHPEELESGAIFSVTEGRIRWRSLPFDRD